MADFRPETTIYLYEGTAVDNENQPFFSSSSEKFSWYSQFPKRVFDEYSYQRENREYIRVEAKAEHLRNYDMLSFRNGDGRDIFCRILNVEFINPNCTEITYEIDYMQTYIDQVTFGQCWVEREMQENDWNGSLPNYESDQPEGIEVGRLVRSEMDSAHALSTPFSTGMKIIVLSALSKDGNPGVTPSSDPENAYPSILNKFTYSLGGTIGDLGTVIDAYAEKDKLDAIAGIYLIPGAGPTIRQQLPMHWSTIEGYEVVNSKCWSGEFCNFIISNKMGQESKLEADYFKTYNTLDIWIDSQFCDGLGGSIAYPRYYPVNPKGVGVYMPWNLQLAYAGSGYYNWLQQNAGTFGAGVASDLIAGAFKGSIVGSPGIGTAMGVVNSVLTALAKTRDSTMNPVYSVSGGSGSGLNYALLNIGFECHLESPSAQSIKTIDEFFGKYGYRTNRYKIPNVNTRPKWNFVKTAGAICRGPFSKTAQLAMQSMMDNGVTFWHLSSGERIDKEWDIAENKE